jgi:hypothetical protein
LDNEEVVVVDSDGQYVTSNPCSYKLWFLFYVPFNRPNEEVDKSDDQGKSIPENIQGGKRKKFVPFVGKNRLMTQVVQSEDDDMWVASNFFYLVSFLSISISAVSRSLHLLPTKRSQSPLWERSAWQLRLLNLRKKNCRLYPFFFPHCFS